MGWPLTRAGEGSVFVSESADASQDLLGKGNQDASKESEQPLGPLAGVVRLDAHAHLHDAPAENDDTQRLDDGKDEVGQVVDDGERVAARGKSGRRGHKKDGEHRRRRPVPPPRGAIALRQISRLTVALVGLAVLHVHVRIPPIQ